MSEDFGGIHGHLASWETILRWRNRWEYCLGWTPVEDDSLHLGEILPPRRAGCEKTWFQTVSRKLMSSGRGDHRWCPPHHDPARRNMRFRRTLDSTVKREYPQHRNFPLGGSHAAMHSPQRSKRPGRESCQSTWIQSQIVLPDAQHCRPGKTSGVHGMFCMIFPERIDDSWGVPLVTFSSG